MSLTPSPHPTSMRTRRRWLAAPSGYRSPWGLSTWTQAMMAVLVVTSLLLAVNVDRVWLITDDALADRPAEDIRVSGPLGFQALAGSLVLQTAALAAAATAFTMWMRRLAANLGTIVEDAMTPRDATVACLVPVLNLVTLPRAVRAMRASTGGLFMVWWALWIVAELTGFGLAAGFVVLSGFQAASAEAVAQGAGASARYAAWTAAVNVGIANALLIAAGAALTIPLVRSTTRQHEIGESQTW